MVSSVSSTTGSTSTSHMDNIHNVGVCWRAGSAEAVRLLQRRHHRHGEQRRRGERELTVRFG
ncbi:unnamed protein product [Cylicostephanus goldi]|uniref:Uncharacterized protein n=1 Tax=Cylicostephanus goldi TaxID=71465 RepID=A0A3P7N4J5_CYLGO|nr:unnamed protein product [Cylicostephanus goldi]